MVIRSSAELGHIVRDYRVRTGLTQAELAGQAGVSRKWIIDLESGKRTVDLSLVLRTLNLLGIELDAHNRPVGPTTPGEIDLNMILDDAMRTRK